MLGICLLEQVRLQPVTECMYRDPADVTWSGRLFQMRGLATEKTRVPTVGSLTCGM